MARRESTVYARLPVAVGPRLLAVGMRDSGRAEGFDHELAVRVEMDEGRNLVVEFDAEGQASWLGDLTEDGDDGCTVAGWRPEFALGIRELDTEHREMIEQINRCYGRSAPSRAPDEVEHALGEIHAAIAGHFALEERIMRTVGYSGYPAHKDDHEELLEQLRAPMDGFMADPAAGRRELEQHLAEWFARHFRTFDAALHGSSARCWARPAGA